jgi:hypothetical protein
MAAPIFQRTIVDSNGNVEIGASVEVRNEANNELAPIFVDRDLTVAKANPFTTDENGLAQFFVAGGEYKVTATKEENVIVWRYVQMIDAELIAAAKLITPRNIGGVSFDGTADIDLPGVNTEGDQNTTGTAENVTGTVAVANGGTGANTLTANNLMVGNGTSAVGFIAPGTAGNVLTSNGTIWQSVPGPESGGGVTVAASAPSSPADGDLWFDTTNNTLKIWVTSSWRGVGGYT